jgi:hypothetical protein
MSEFEFVTDAKSEAFCGEIVATMMELFGLSRAEAIGRINRDFTPVDFFGEEHIYYHETPDYWAQTIYYGRDSKWWLNPEGLRPLPYP